MSCIWKGGVKLRAHSKIVFLICFLALLFTGCKNQNQENAKADTPEPSKMDKFDSLIESINHSINICNVDNTSVNHKASVNDEKFKMNLLYSASIEGYEAQVPIRIWMIADGEPIEFQLDNDEASTVHNVSAENGNDFSAELTFEGKSSMRYITVVVSAIPNRVPVKGREAIGGISTYTIINTLNEEEIDNSVLCDEQSYCKITSHDNNVGIGIDTKPIDESGITSAYFVQNMILSEKSKAWVKFNSSPPVNMAYSLMVLCDGEIVPFADGKCLVPAYTPLDGTKPSSMGIQYEIDNQKLPKDGVHYIQAIAIPYNTDSKDLILSDDSLDALSSLETERIRFEFGEE